MRMGKLVSATVVLLALTASAHATTFLYTGALQTYEVLSSGVYSVIVAGAQGGGQTIEFPSGFSLTVGGAGALISGDVFLSAGTTLTILSGGGGSANCDCAGSGGGMSFIAFDSSNPLIVAGGGGGSNFRGVVGGAGQIATSGGSNDYYAGGQGGQGGSGPQAGAGWLSNGSSEIPAFVPYQYGTGGQTGPTWAGGAGFASFPGSNGHGIAGGFGGGGGGGYNCGGGGGGYSGGSGATCVGDQTAESAGGGGSFIAPSVFAVTAIAGGNGVERAFTGAPGFVTINFLSSAVPEPATWAMFLLGFGAIGFAMRRRKEMPAVA